MTEASVRVKITTAMNALANSRFFDKKTQSRKMV